ncbi:MAG: DUF268 domain-containing protein [Rhodobacteraceae bacterium]|nr:DUF268 domain-containing protein [Paracoccaceae bacterium]
MQLPKLPRFIRRITTQCRSYLRYKKQRKEWLSGGGVITKNHIILEDYEDDAGIVKGHYFHQDLLVARLIFENNPIRHVDVGSRIDGFVAHVACYREVEVVDIRPLEESEHKNIQFKQLDFTKKQKVQLTDSLSCLHSVEHFGLGRYSDPIDINGHITGIENMVELIQKGGIFYISFPIGLSDEVHFNAHRVFHPRTIFNIPDIQRKMELIRFDFVDDNGNLHQDKDIDDAVGKFRYGCGIYTFRKILD